MVVSKFTSSEVSILIEDIAILFDCYIKQYVNKLHNPNFESVLLDDMMDILMEQFSINTDDILNKTKLESVLKYVLDNFCYKYIIPKRAIKTKFKNVVTEKDRISMAKKIEYLKNIPQPDQRTDEWYTFRHGLITASNAWKCLGSQSQKNSIIFEKCKPLVLNNDVEKPETPNVDTYVNTQTTLHFGQKYEPLSVMYYEFTYNTTVGEFGCIPHSKYSFLGASPDGINIDEDSCFFGRMLEIKNICNREITGNPKLEYFVQTQLQMETCDLNKCDFLETRFIEYQSEEEFSKDGTFQLTEDGKYKGIIMHFKGDGKPIYEYSPFNCTKEAYDVWENEMFKKHDGREWMENLYWKLDEVSCVLIVRNKKWFNSIIGEIQEVWNTILKERVDGYEHRKPRKRTAEVRKIEDCMDVTVKRPAKRCMIDISSL